MADLFMLKKMDRKKRDQNNTEYSSSLTLSNFVDASDYDLRFPTWSMEYLKRAATDQRLVKPHSLAWAILLNAIPPPPYGEILVSISGHRNFYNDLKAKLSMDPRDVIGDDPLSQSEKSVWKQHFCDNELKALILQDVVRTYPDEAYFRDKDVQDMMVRVLFFWARCHPSPGYRQGMHEVLAPLLFELHLDRIHAPEVISDTLREFLEERYLEHDSYMLFSAVMKGLERFYTTGDVAPTPTGRLPTSTTVHNQNEVIKYLQSIKEDYLMKLDPELATHLDECGISMELFGIRWLRLLFGREFPREDIPQLWGFLFADGPMLPNVHYFILAMLISIRNTLMETDASGALSVLMRPSLVPAAHVRALALHLSAPRTHPAPPPPLPPPRDLRREPISMSPSVTLSESRAEEEGVEWSGSEGGGDGSEGVAEGGDVARALGALALLRARLPPAARALSRALPRPPAAAQQPLNQILQLAALLECRNHSLIDVETALEAAENQSTDAVGRRVIVPVVINNRPRDKVRTNKPVQVKKVREVPLKLFHQAECNSASDLPYLDPLRLRTE